MAITVHIEFTLFICTILYGLLESFKIILLNDFIPEIIEIKVTGKRKTTLVLIIFLTRSLNKVILEDSNRPNMIVQMNVLHVIYIVL